MLLKIFEVGIKRAPAGNTNLTVTDTIILVLKAMRADEVNWGMDVDRTKEFKN